MAVGTTKATDCVEDESVRFRISETWLLLNEREFLVKTDGLSTVGGICGGLSLLA